MHDLVALHDLQGRIPDDVQHRDILAICSSDAAKSGKLARTIRRHEGADAIADASIAVCSIRSIQFIGISFPLETSFGDEVEQGELIVCIMVKFCHAENHVERITSRYPEDGLEPKLAQSLQDITTDKDFSGHLNLSPAVEDVTVWEKMINVFS